MNLDTRHLAALVRTARRLGIKSLTAPVAVTTAGGDDVATVTFELGPEPVRTPRKPRGPKAPPAPAPAKPAPGSLPADPLFDALR